MHTRTLSLSLSFTHPHKRAHTETRTQKKRHTDTTDTTDTPTQQIIKYTNKYSQRKCARETGEGGGGERESELCVREYCLPFAQCKMHYGDYLLELESE